VVTGFKHQKGSGGVDYFAALDVSVKDTRASVLWMARGSRKVEMVILLDAYLKHTAPHEVAWQKLRKDWKQSFSLQLTGRSSLPIASYFGSSWSIVRWMLVKEMKELGHRFLEVVLRHPGKVTTTFDENESAVALGIAKPIVLKCDEILSGALS